MKREPIDYSNPLGISKREWVKVLGVNLGLLLITYVVALVFTLCGSDAFLIGTENPAISDLASRLNSWGVYPLITIAFATIEETLMVWFIILKRPKWWMPASYFAARVLNNFIFLWAGANAVPTWSFLTINVLFCLGFALSHGKRCGKPLIRMAITIVLSFALNELIALFRSKAIEINHYYVETAFIYLSIEYDLAFGLSLGFLAMVIPWEKGGAETCYPTADAGGSSPNSTNSSPKSSKTARTDGLPLRYKKRLFWLKARVMAIQTIAIIVIAALPCFTGKPVEFALVYASFCMTRMTLGFNRSLHFKSEASCVIVGALTFWALTYLTPNVEASIVFSLAYGAGLALGFRLYWELHDLIMYRKASKTDRFAMLYVVFKGNCDPKHVNGVMRAKGILSKDDIKMVQLYMQREKVEYIADWMGYAKITVEKKLTDLANYLYQLR